MIKNPANITSGRQTRLHSYSVQSVRKLCYAVLKAFKSNIPTEKHSFILQAPLNQHTTGVRLLSDPQGQRACIPTRAFITMVGVGKVKENGFRRVTDQVGREVGSYLVPRTRELTL